jgi:hypothetical protein
MARTTARKTTRSFMIVIIQMDGIGVRIGVRIDVRIDVRDPLSCTSVFAFSRAVPL